MNISKIERMACIGFIIGIIFKLMYLPFAGQILILSLGALAMVYFLSVTKNKVISNSLFLNNEENIEGNSFGRFALRLGGWGLSIALIGILFKILFWPNANFFLVMGLCALVFALGIFQTKVKESFPVLVSKFTLRILIIGGIAIALYATPKIELFAFFHRDNPEYVEAVRASWADPNNAELKKEVERLRSHPHSKEMK